MNLCTNSYVKCIDTLYYAIVIVDGRFPLFIRCTYFSIHITWVVSRVCVLGVSLFNSIHAYHKIYACRVYPIWMRPVPTPLLYIETEN